MPYDTIVDARDAIIGFFATTWNAQTPPVPPVAYPDNKFTAPVDGSAWVRFTIQHGPGSKQVTLGARGNRRFRRVGIITIQIFTPPDDGLTASDGFVNLVQTIFEGNSVKPDTVQFLNVRVTEIGLNGTWNQTNVLIDFNWDAIR